MERQNARFIWTDAYGQGRNLYGLFRKTFIYHGNVTSAALNVFADTTYQLFINGQFVQFGPVRFDPRYPQYDSHNIAPYLKKGKNVIAISVNYQGYKTYKAIPAGAGMIVWGSVHTDENEEIILDSNKNSWRAIQDKAHWRYERKATFALSTINIYDQIGEEAGWRSVNFEDGHWPYAIEIENQKLWGDFSPRSIPFISLKEIPIKNIVHILPLKKQEELFSFSVPIKHYYEDNRCEFSDFIAYQTWIYSPIDQTVTVGTFWGELWLNNKPILDGLASKKKNMRINRRFKLQRGWNFFFGKVGAYADSLDFYLAFPKEKGIILSADKSFESLNIFKHSPILSKNDFEKYISFKQLPYTPEESLAEIGGWIYADATKMAQDPCKETSWDIYDEAYERLCVSDLSGHIFSVNDYPDGFSITFDLGFTHLFLPFLEMKGICGATIDVTYSERLNEDCEHLSHLFHYGLGDRILCSQDRLEWAPSDPRGGQYVKLTVRNPITDITLSSFKLKSANYPVLEIGEFKCSDDCLSEVWNIGKRTLQTNMEDVYVDCVTRERGMYGRDTIIQYYINSATFGDQALMRRCMQLYGQSSESSGKFRAVYPNTGEYSITDFALNLLEGYIAYYENTGDTQFIEDNWNAIQKNMSWFHDLADEREDLLLDADWHIRRNVKAYYGGYHGDGNVVEGYHDKTGVNCAFSCVYLEALNFAVCLAKAISRSIDLPELERRIQLLKDSILKKFWNEDKGCFSDNLKGITHSVQTNILAVRAGVVKPSQLGRVKSYVKSQLKSIFVNGYNPDDGAYVSPHFSFYILDGLYQLGLYETAENMMRQGWGWVLTNGLKTCPEFFSFESDNKSLCHAWSASPTYYLSKNVLGVNFPEAPNTDIVAIHVKAHGITYAEGKYPHPKGNIEIKWHMEDGERVFDLIKVPDGVKVISYQ